MTNLGPTLARGKDYLAIPGPSVMPDEVLRAMHRAAPNIYEGELVELTKTVIEDLKRVARTEGSAAIYIGNGHAAWEAALANVVGPGDAVLAPATGRFGKGWADMAVGLGAEARVIDFGSTSTVDPERVKDALREDSGGCVKAILATHVDTSTSVRNDILEMRAALDDVGHPALLMADCIASLACDPFEMDAWGVDVTVAASQKGLMVPPGLGFVLFSERAAAARRAMERVSRYWDWAPRAEPGHFYQHFGGTAPTHHLYGLRAALDMIAAEGLENAWARHGVLARAIWAACDAWSEGGALRLNVPDASIRSHAVTAVLVSEPRAEELRHWLSENLGLTLGIGLDMGLGGDSTSGDRMFRIGHMGHLNGHMVMGLLGGIEAGLRALGLAAGSGALEAAAAVMAEPVADARSGSGGSRPVTPVSENRSDAA